MKAHFDKAIALSLVTLCALVITPSVVSAATIFGEEALSVVLAALTVLAAETPNCETTGQRSERPYTSCELTFSALALLA